MREVLTGEARETALVALAAAGWALTEDGHGLHKIYKFKGFPQAFGWMAAVATEAQKLDHHPEWKNVYNRVEVVLTTHSAGGITGLDVALAGKMDLFAS
jgi:4a-hydroxytetrahydrobiopterin dehydratase